jgi:glucose/arabinose dehydrogenase
VRSRFLENQVSSSNTIGANPLKIKLAFRHLFTAEKEKCRMKKFTGLLMLLFILIPQHAHLQPSLAFELVSNSFDAPVDITNAGDGSKRLFIVDQTGYIRIIDSLGNQLADPFLDIDSKIFTQDERGLLGLAFHPDYANNGYFYVNYTDNNSDTKIARYQVSPSNPDSAVVSSEKIMFDINQPYSNHNGGCLKFSPVDGYLYIAVGDGGSAGDPECRAQDSLSFFGKILRVDVNQNVDVAPYYGIPADNPFVGNADGADEIWCVGLRNPWRISFDRDNGNLWIADVGQDEQEEVNFQLVSSNGGENYGWKVMEGEFCYDPDPIDSDCPTGTPSCNSPIFTDPLFNYPHSGPESGHSLTGGFVYRGCRYPQLEGYYIMADYISGNVWLLDSLGNDIFFDNLTASISSFGESENGELYATSLATNALYEVRETSIPYDLVITEANNPIRGMYEAVNSITVQGSIVVFPGQTTTFFAQKIYIQDTLSVNIESVIQIEKICD